MDKEINNYYLEFVKEYKEIRKKEEGKPKLLLHVCCGPCSAYPLVFLQDLFDITILYSNSNIYPKEEYDKRLYNLKRYVNEINLKFNKHILVIEDNYDYDSFKEDLLPFKNQKEGLNRCKICIAKRMKRLFIVAKERNFKYVTTVMSISRNKDAVYINKIGKAIENNLYKNEIEFIYTDFKKNDGQEIGIKIAKKYNLYRQDYCGCEFSLPLNKREEKIIDISIVLLLKDVIKEEQLRKCLDSLVNQEGNIAYEIFISLRNKDENNKTYKIIEEYKNKYNELFNVHYLTEESKENITSNNNNKNNFTFDESDIKNYALKNSNGRYIVFIESSSYLSKDFLSVNYKVALKNNADVVNFLYKNIKENKKVSSFNHSFYLTKFYNKNNKKRILKALFNDVFVRGYLFNKFFKKDFLKNQNIFFMKESSCIEDIFFSYLVFLYSKKVVFINKTLLYRYKNLNKEKFDINKFSLKLINSWFLIRYVSIKEGYKNIGVLSFLPKSIMLSYNGLKFYKNLDISYFSYLKRNSKQLKKLVKNEYKYEGEEWEKALYIYLEKSKDNHY